MYTLVPPSYRCFISNLDLIGEAVSEKKILMYMYITPGCFFFFFFFFFFPMLTLP